MCIQYDYQLYMQDGRHTQYDYMQSGIWVEYEYM